MKLSPRVDVGGREMAAPKGEQMVEQAPPGVPLTEREQHLTLQMVCLLIANGESVKATAGKLGLTVESVERAMGTPKAMEMIVRFQHETCPDPAVRVKKMASIALDVQTKLLLNPNTSDTTKAKVANEVIDRAHGKAIQVTENRNLNFDLKDALSVEKALAASQERLARIEEMQKRLSIPVGRADNPDDISRIGS